MNTIPSKTIQLSDELRKQQLRLEYTVIGFITGALVLSIKYSPEFGNILKPVLIISWFLYLLSMLLGILKINKYLSNATLHHFCDYLPPAYQEEIDKKVKITAKQIKWVERIQVSIFIIALVLNLIYASVNFLNSAP